MNWHKILKLENCDVVFGEMKRADTGEMERRLLF